MIVADHTHLPTHDADVPDDEAELDTAMRREEESNPVAKHSDLEASLPHSLPHPAHEQRRDIIGWER